MHFSSWISFSRGGKTVICKGSGWLINTLCCVLCDLNESRYNMAYDSAVVHDQGMDIALLWGTFTAGDQGWGLVGQGGQAVVNSPLLSHLERHHRACPNHQLCCPAAQKETAIQQQKFHKKKKKAFEFAVPKRELF